MNEKIFNFLEKSKNKKRIYNLESIKSEIINETLFLPKYFTLRNRFYYIKNNIDAMIICKRSSCRNSVKMNSHNKPNKYCSIKCSALDGNVRSKYKKTCLKIYGVDNPLKNEEIKEKVRNTTLKKYNGIFNGSSYIFEKSKLTLKKNFGVDSPLKNEKIKEKVQNTCQKKYGGIGWQSNHIRKKYNKTCLEKYGTENPSKSEKIKKQTKQTCLKKFGVDNPFKNSYVIDKIRSKRLLSRMELAKRFKNAHGNKYDYSAFTTYKGLQSNINVICKEHGEFQQRPDNHINGANCPKCANSGFSKKAIDWLNHISETKGFYIQHALNEGEYKIPGTRYHVDGYCKENNTCYEFLGDVWHGNQEVFEKKQIVHPFKDMSVKKCYNQTTNRLKEIKNLGYNIEYIWENDWNKMNRNKDLM